MAAIANVNNKSLWRAELAATLRLAWPLILAQLAQIAFFTTDVVMMGWLGPHYLASGTLATALLHPVQIGGIGVVTAAAPMIAQALGARDTRSVRRTVRQGFWIALLVSAIGIPVLLLSPFIFAALGQNPGISAGASLYLSIAAFTMVPALLFTVLRSLISAKDKTSVILAITLFTVVLNGFANYGLMFGHFGLPRLELAGAAIATVLSNTLMFVLALIYATTHKRFKRHYILVRFFKPDWPRFFEFFRIGVPIGLTLLAEIGMFGVAVIMMGWLGPDEVAAHAVALQCAAISFMVPLGLAQATTIRVGLKFGQGDAAGAGIAGWASLLLTMAFMSLTCLTFLTIPQILTHLFLDPGRPENQLPITLAVSYLAVAALFQFFDGMQVSMAAALRGLSDTKTPMIIATLGYWIVGMGTAYMLGFVLDWRGVGVWLGLAAGLGFVGVVLFIRWIMRERLGLLARV